ncbi:MAG: putative type restriction enzymeP protein [Schlesneria sp.]|nr:putative type restriction enzymeP protein [Schlesneria sp.]
MRASFTSDGQSHLFEAIVSELSGLRYTGDLLEKSGYSFSDWFRPNAPLRRIGAAAFGQTPVSYDTACFGVALSSGKSGAALVSDYRALGAPIIFEVGENEAIEWSVGTGEETTHPSGRFGLSQVSQYFAKHEKDWTPREFLRTKTLGAAHPSFQQSLFAGVIPELESNIRDTLDPILSAALAATSREYTKETASSPDEFQLFRLAFGILTAKVFHDRGHPDFSDISANADPGDAIMRVATHYHERWPRLLNRTARQVAFDRIWSKMDFRNLSVDVLSHIWSSTLVTGALRKRLGIHRTPRSIVRYIVDRIPFDNIPEEERFVVEPCCGSAVFLVAALNRMRDLLDSSITAQERHAYFQRMLRGFERDPAGVEISRLCLALSDYPSANGWEVTPGDVFRSQPFRDSLKTSRVVLCNPPYEDFAMKDRKGYSGAIRPPVELLNISLENLHSEGILGFVLPRVFIDGNAYADIRGRIAARFGSVEIVTLPDKGWEHADKETVLLLATEPHSGHRRTKVTHRKVAEKGWQAFDWFHSVTSEDSEAKNSVEAKERLSIPDLGKLWHRLRHNQCLKDVASIHRGIEWNENLVDPITKKETGWREVLVQKKKFKNSKLGIPPRSAPFYAFETPPTAFLDMSDEYKRRDSHLLPWHEPKVIFNSKTKSRGAWRLAAFVDTAGLVAYQTFTAVWPKVPEDICVLAAVLNGPVANAFVATREGKTDITNDTIEDIPLPVISAEQRTEIENLTRAYLSVVERSADEIMSQAEASEEEATAILRTIDAVVLEGYDLPPRLERSLLDYFRGAKRQSRFHFPEYFPPTFRPYFSLREYLSAEFHLGCADEFRKDFEPPPPDVLAAMQKAAEAFRS